MTHWRVKVLGDASAGKKTIVGDTEKGPDGVEELFFRFDGPG